VTSPKDQAGRSFVSFLVEEEIQPLPVRSEMVGIDPGLLDVVTRSTGEKTGNERCFRNEEKRLARRPRRHEKSRKGSKNREKARRKVARLQARIADRRHDFQHNLPTRLIGENHVVGVESLAVKHLLQHHALAKSLADGGWGEIIRH
jgi:putative transposase